MTDPIIPSDFTLDLPDPITLPNSPVFGGTTNLQLDAVFTNPVNLPSGEIGIELPLPDGGINPDKER